MLSRVVLLLALIGLNSMADETKFHESGLFFVGAPKSGKTDMSRNALGALIAANHGEWPKTLDELRNLLDRVYGTTTSFIVPYSGAPKYTDLNEPRMTYMSPAGDLYIGAIERPNGKVDMEFQARDNDTDGFDFGEVEGFGTKTPDPHSVELSSCVTCHPGGPVFYGTNWRTTLAKGLGNTDLLKDKIEPMTNNLGPGFAEGFSIALHTAFLENVAKKDPQYKDLAEMARAHYNVEKGKSQQADNFYVKAKHRRYKGADLVVNARDVEVATIRGNQITVLHSLVKKMEPTDKRKVITYLLRQSFCIDKTDGVNPADEGLASILQKELLVADLHQPVLLKTPALSHLIPETENDTFTDVDKINELQRKKSEKRVRNLDPNESALHAENFLPSTVPILGQTSYFSIRAKMVTEAYAASLRVKGPLKSFCASDEFTALTHSDRLPNVEAVHTAIANWKKNGGKSTLNRPVKSCMDCHSGKGGDEDGTRFPFDVGSLAAWKEKLTSKNPSDVASAKKWIKKVYRQLEQGKMPPKDYSPHLTATELSALKQYLGAFE